MHVGRPRHQDGGSGAGRPRGVPNRLMTQDNRTKRIDARHLPSPSEALHLYQQNGGRIQEESSFGSDPIAGDSNKQQIRDTSYTQRNPPFDSVFSSLVNGDSAPFVRGLRDYISITHRLSSA